MDECWRELRNAILLQAVGDYHRLVTNQTTPKNNCNYAEIEEFLKSKWCGALLADMPISGTDILKVLQGYKQEHAASDSDAEAADKKVDKIQFFNGWSRDKIKCFIHEHNAMQKVTYEGKDGMGYKHVFTDGQTYELRLGDFLRHQPTEIYINGELAQRHQY